MEELYKVDIAGREELLPVLTLPTGVKIAFFNLHGNQELTEYCGKKIADQLKKKNIDVLITAESKGLQLTHVVAKELGHDFYAVARKVKKTYMQDPLEVDVSTITEKDFQKLYLAQGDSKLLHGKRVAIVDDVISTGGSIRGMETLVKQSGGKVTCVICVLAEGDSIKKKDVLRLGEIPIL